MAGQWPLLQAQAQKWGRRLWWGFRCLTRTLRQRRGDGRMGPEQNAINSDSSSWVLMIVWTQGWGWEGERGGARSILPDFWREM